MGQRRTETPLPGRVRPGRGGPRPGSGRAGPTGPATGMTRSGSPAARKRKPATTRHPPAPRSAQTAPRTGRCRCAGVAVEYEPPRLSPAAEDPRRQSPLEQLGLDGAPHDDARRVDGHSPQPPGWSQLPCNLRATRALKASYIHIRSRHRRPDLAQISAHCTAERSKPRPDVHSPGAGAYEEDGQNQERNEVHPSNPHSGALEAKCSP